MMWMRIVAVFVFCVVASFLPINSAAQIRLNEILADPASDWDGDGGVNSRSDEWVEIVNIGSSAVDLSSYRLGDVSGDTSWRYGFSGTVAPGEIRLVYGSDAVLWESANGFPAFGLSLNNSGDTVFLFDVAGGDTIVVDQYTYSSFEVQDDRTTGRDPDGTGDWVIFDGLNPYSGSAPPFGNGCAPTPGGTNDCSTSVPVKESTWGAIKALWSE
jgi:hypothetical protein